MVQKRKRTRKSTQSEKSRVKKMGEEMIRLAKAYRREHPGAKWSTSMKQAGVEYRKRHKKK